MFTHRIPRRPSSYRDYILSVDRVQKLKDARSEAAKESEAYKIQKQKEYEAYESEVCSIQLPLPPRCLNDISYIGLLVQHKSQTSSNQHSIDESTNKQLEEIKRDVEKNRENVIEKILERVTKTDPALHKNLRKIEA